MPTLLSIGDIIEVGDISTYLSANYVSKGQMFGGTKVKVPSSVLISFVTDGLRWGDESGAETDASLRSTANYLYWLCGIFQLEAQQIMGNPGGGSISPLPPGGSVPNPLDFIVGASSTIPTGGTSVTISQFIGYNVDFERNSMGQYTTNPGDSSTWFSWNRISGLFTLNDGAAQEGERFRISPFR